MSKLIAAFFSAGLLVIIGGAARAHHAMTIFELSAITLEGTVQEFRFVNPHTILVLKATDEKGSTKVWHLESDPPSMLARAGFSRDTFKRGDRLKMYINPLRDGKPGGFWSIRTVITQNGREFLGHQCLSSPDRCP